MDGAWMLFFVFGANNYTNKIIKRVRIHSYGQYSQYYTIFMLLRSEL